jgi:hypothetical protein
MWHVWEGEKSVRGYVGKRPLGRSRRRWEDGVRMDLKDDWGGVECIHLAWDKDHWQSLVDTVMNQSRSIAIFRYSLRSCAEKYFKTVRINFFGFLHNFFVMI